MIEKIQVLEIEFNAMCNRKCSWCPNSYIDRTKNINMRNDIFMKLLEELKEHGYSGYISLSRYNEPLCNIRKLKDVCKIIKRELPECKIIFNTNGDLLSMTMLLDLEVDEITVMDYDDIGEKRVQKILSSLNVNKYHYNGKYFEAKFKNIKLLFDVEWNKCKLYNRADSIVCESIERTEPCYHPYTKVVVDYTGSVMPCCNMRADIHHPYIMGNLYTESLNDILKSDKYKKFADDVRNCRFPRECRKCNMGLGRYQKEVDVNEK